MLEELVRSDLKRDEGLRLRPYKCTAGRWTIGYGHNLEATGEYENLRKLWGAELKGYRITEKDASKILDRDIENVFQFIAKALPNFKDYPLGVKRALVNMAFQMGINGLLSFKTTLRFIDEGKYKEASTQALKSKWAQQTPERAKRVSKMIESEGVK